LTSEEAKMPPASSLIELIASLIVFRRRRHALAAAAPIAPKRRCGAFAPRTASPHRIFPRTPDGQSLAEPLVVSIDLSEIAFT
jgi:hypothetical protein